MTEPYPFLFFEHGALDPECIDKCEEVFVWFQRPLTQAERAQVVASCPPPLAGSFTWGDCFAYFGSGGDTYDFDIVSTYGDDALKARLAKLGQGDDDDEGFPDIYRAIAKALPKFTRALDAWALEVHALVGIVFLMGPHGAPADDPWNRYSESHAARALDALRAWRAANPWHALGDDAGETLVEPAPEAPAKPAKPAKSPAKKPRAPRGRADAWLPAPQSRARVAEIFSWIASRIERLAFETADDATRRALVDSVYAADRITKPFGRLSPEESTLHTNARLAASYLGAAKSEARRSRLEGLEPYTQLAYLASYEALQRDELRTYTDPIARLRALIAQVAPAREPCVTTLLRFMADNLMHNTPAFSKPRRSAKPSKKDRALARLAAEITALAHERDDCPIEAYVNGGTWFEWAGDDERCLAVALAGLTRFGDAEQLLRNALGAAGRLARAEVTAELSARLSRRGKPPREETLLNQTYALVKAQKLDEARAAIDAYLQAKGAPTPRVLVNYTYVLRERPPEGAALEKALDLVERTIRTSAEHQRTLALIENAVSFLNENGRAPQSIELARLAVTKGKTGWSPALLWNTSQSAYVARDEGAMREVLATARETLRADAHAYDAHGGIFENLAELAALTNDRSAALAYLEKRAKLRPSRDDVARIERSEALASLRGEPRFLAALEAMKPTGSAAKKPRAAKRTPATRAAGAATKRPRTKQR